jgi:outer membrane protein insertion porin family
MTAFLLSFYFLTSLAQVDLAPDPVDAFADKIVFSISFDLAASENLDEIKSLVDIQPGYILTGDMVQQAIKRLYALERFNDVRVYAEPHDEVVALHFELPPKHWLKRLRIVGNQQVKTLRLFEALKVNEGATLDTRARDRATGNVLTYLRTVGYKEAQVRIDSVIEDKLTGAENWKVHVTEGQPARVKDILFIGQPGLHAGFIETLIKTRRGDNIDAIQLFADKQRLLDEYRAHGFRQVVVDDPKVANDQVIFHIIAGPRIDVVFVGNNLLNDTQLSRLWPEATPGFSEHELSYLGENIRAAYRQLGYPNAQVSLSGYQDLEHNILRYVLTINEGQPLRVISLKFTGATVFSEKILRQQVRSVLRQNLKESTAVETMKDAELEPAANAAKVTARRVFPMPIDARYIPEFYDEALNQITAAYRNKGYLQVRVGPVELAENAGVASINIPVEEGPQTFIQSIALRENQAISAEELMHYLEQQPDAPTLGKPYSANGIEDARIALLKIYRERGYAYARIFTEMSVADSEDPTKHFADVQFHVEDGPQVHIRNILIRGNHYTRDKIIRIQIAMKPGDLYRYDQAVDAQRAIAGLGVFSNVRVKLIDEEHPDEYKDIVADVSERPRQPIDFGVGISTSEGPRARISYSHINVAGTASTFTSSLKVNRQIFFDLYGAYADTMKERYHHYNSTDQISRALERELRVGIYSPTLKMILGDPRLRLDLVNARTNTIPYSLDTIAAIFGVDFIPQRRLKFSIEPQLSISNLECDSTASPNCRNQTTSSGPLSIDVGMRRMFKLSPTLTLDKRDNPFNPSRGFFIQLKGAYALGESRSDPAEKFSDIFVSSLPDPFSFARVEANVTTYLPLGPLVLAVSLRAGTIFDLQHRCAPVDERFLLGGRATLRGFVERAMLPQDVRFGDSSQAATCLEATRTLDVSSGLAPITKGGNHYFLAKTELRIPIIGEFTLVAFADTGNLWVVLPKNIEDITLRLGTGAGIRYNTPVGALELDLGINTAPRTYRDPTGAAVYKEDVYQVHFSVGSF